jgi:hypothetical protein
MDVGQQDLRRVQQSKTWRQRLRHSDREVIRRICLGQSSAEISRALGIGRVTISRVINSQVGQEAIEAMQDRLDMETLSIAARIRQFAPQALRLIEETISGQHPEASIRLRVQYASEHLDRAGFGAVKKNVSLTGQLSREEMDAIKTRSKEALEELQRLKEAQAAECRNLVSSPRPGE